MAIKPTPDGRYDLGGNPLSCPVCSGDSFEHRLGVMETRGATFLGVAWANRGCTELICKECGYVMTFADPY